MDNAYVCRSCKTKNHPSVNVSIEKPAAAELSALKTEGILCLQCSEPLGLKFAEDVSKDQFGIGSAAQGGGSGGGGGEGKVITGEEETGEEELLPSDEAFQAALVAPFAILKNEQRTANLVQQNEQNAIAIGEPQEPAANAIAIGEQQGPAANAIAIGGPQEPAANAIAIGEQQQQAAAVPQRKSYMEVLKSRRP